MNKCNLDVTKITKKNNKRIKMKNHMLKKDKNNFKTCLLRESAWIQNRSKHLMQLFSSLAIKIQWSKSVRPIQWLKIVQLDQKRKWYKLFTKKESLNLNKFLHTIQKLIINKFREMNIQKDQALKRLQWLISNLKYPKNWGNLLRKIKTTKTKGNLTKSSTSLSIKICIQLQKIHQVLISIQILLKIKEISKVLTNNQEEEFFQFKQAKKKLKNTTHLF